MSKLKKYEAVFDEEKTEGVFAISLVKKPATKEVFIALSDQEKQIQTEIHFSTVNEDEQILIGLVLEPNTPIYRNQEGEEFTVTFKEDTIQKLAYNFFKQDFHKNSTLEHDEDQKISGVTFVESWIVRNPDKDVSNEYGLTYPKGSWLATMKVDDDDIWNNYIKTGKVKGFSIDGLVQLKEIKDEKQKIKMSIFRKLGLSNKKKEEDEQETTLELGSAMLVGGEIQIEWEGDELEAGKSIFATMPNDAESDERVPVPVGEYELEDGRIIIVEEEGVVASVNSPQSSGEPEGDVEASGEEGEKTGKIKSILIKYNEDKNTQEAFKNIESLLVEMKEGFDDKFKDLEAKYLDLSEQEIDDKKKTPTVEVNLSEMSEYQKRQYYKENN